MPNSVAKPLSTPEKPMKAMANNQANIKICSGQKTLEYQICKANIFTDKYDENAFEYYDVARKLVEQTADDNMKGYVLSNTADACVHFRKSDKALKYYAEAVKNYEKTNATEEIAQNYKSAAELMIQFNSPNKAKSLLKKAMVNAVKTQNEDLISVVIFLFSI